MRSYHTLSFGCQQLYYSHTFPCTHDQQAQLKVYISTLKLHTSTLTKINLLISNPVTDHNFFFKALNKDSI